MADLVNRNEIYRLCNQLSLTLTHFAKGIYPTAAKEPASLTVNRMLAILANPNGDANNISAGGTVYPLTPGTVCFIPAGCPATVRFDRELTFVSIQFNLELYFGVELFSALKRPRSFHRPELAGRLSRIFGSENALPLALELKKQVWAFICELLEESGASPLESAARFAPYSAVLEYISTHCTARTRIAELAKVMNLPRETFTRRFTADTGISPKRFFDRRLLHRASELLRRPHITAREVAYELEFSSEFVFSRFFKTRTGMPPNAYRNLYRA